MDSVQVITLSIACAGCVLGVLNTWKAYDKERIKLVVKTFNTVFGGAHGGKDLDRQFAVQVVNGSAYAVSLAEIGFLYRGSVARTLVLPLIMDDSGSLLPASFPRRIDARDSQKFFMTAPSLHKGGKPFACAYVMTVDGRMFKADGPARKMFVLSPDDGSKGQA